ncbi:hypothetical protein GCM10010193_70280 [Kitasatospora atroaurantiaca]|uniref:Uncharacterized protein n=1 Tax=Kitasatospora atroaurantiaca TaxID=285545 RepID=A0A561ENC7_9ACTN|nr:hypothetical protein [Kitasatospora atroaurantiaca]TWE17114.1 hypothetical protein FB465_2119 [Kitasatospora atroaurantiaca]
MSDWDNERWLPKLPGQRKGPPPPPPAPEPTEDRAWCRGCHFDFPFSELRECAERLLCGDCAEADDQKADHRLTQQLAYAA